MPNYRRVYLPGGTYFLTIVTYCRRPLFKNGDNIELLRSAVAKVKTEKPFKIVAAVILPDHIHFLWVRIVGYKSAQIPCGIWA